MTVTVPTGITPILSIESTSAARHIGTAARQADTIATTSCALTTDLASAPRIE